MFVAQRRALPGLAGTQPFRIQVDFNRDVDTLVGFVDFDLYRGDSANVDAPEVNRRTDRGEQMRDNWLDVTEDGPRTRAGCLSSRRAWIGMPET